MLKKSSITTITVLLYFFSEKISAQSSYEQLQAAYVYNFAKYITWPDEVQVFTIGILGRSKITGDLKNILVGKKISGKDIEIGVVETLEDAVKYQIIYLPSRSSDELEKLLKIIDKKNILLVTEDDLVKNGAMISFFVENERLRFKVNQKEFTKSKLRATEELLKLAVVL